MNRYIFVKQSKHFTKKETFDFELKFFIISKNDIIFYKYAENRCLNLHDNSIISDQNFRFFIKYEVIF